MNKKSVTSAVSIAPALAAAEQPHPLYASQPAAGFPSPGDDMVEQPLDLNDLLVENPTATFFVRVTGDSMEGARIFSGDVLVSTKGHPSRRVALCISLVFPLLGKMIYY